MVLPAYAAALLLLSAVQPPLSIDIFTGTALSSKPAAAARRERMMRQTHRQTDRQTHKQTDRQTDRRTDARQFHRPSFTYYSTRAVPTNLISLQYEILIKSRSFVNQVFVYIHGYFASC